MSARNVLHAWVCGDYVGRFERDFEMDKPRFVRDESSTSMLSLSLGGNMEATAGENYLAALIPEREAARESIQRITGAASTSNWDLLTAIGGDLPGGVVLHPEENGPDQEEPFSRVASEAVIAARITDIKAGGSGYDASYGSKPRFSLAGAQGKFAISEVDGELFWSDSATPSTHILKPESDEHKGIELIEAATLELARRVGIDAPSAAQAIYAGESTFQIERFDRARDQDGVPYRVHAEDMTQALGVSLKKKYNVDANEIIELLRRTTGDDELGYSFYRQYAFNVIIGNADAHGKNYSLLHRDGGIELSPLYDAIPIRLFPHYDQMLAMPVGGANSFLTVTPESWVGSAEDAGLNPERIRVIVQEISDGVREHLDATVGAVDHARVTARGLNEIRESADRQVGDIPLRSAMTKTIDLAQAPPAPVRPSSDQSRRGDQGLGKTAGGGNAGSFAAHRRTEADGSALGLPPRRDGSGRPRP